MNLAKIQITNPCSNYWGAMEKVPQGRFCASCSKNVIDFSGKSDAEIQDFVKKHASEKICGRFYKHQVGRIRIEFEKNILQSDIKFWQKFLVVLLICFGSETIGVDFCLAQSEVQDTTIVAIDTNAVQADTLVEVAGIELAKVDTNIEFIPVKMPDVQEVTFIMGDYYISGAVTICEVPPEKDEEIVLFEEAILDTHKIKDIGINQNLQAKRREKQQQEENQDLRKLMVLSPFVGATKRRRNSRTK